jgi:pantoate--beta-alanine ligase
VTRVLRTVEEVRHALAEHHARAEVTGFVPTMGALHAGHGMLLERCADECPVRVLSVYVNPTQFGPGEDLARYPRTFEADVELARAKGFQYVFAPTDEVIYPAGYETFLDVAKVSEPLCGKARPGHFRGVATVVHRLFRIVRPQVAYFGQKDLQQCLVIDRMARDLELPVKIAICPIVREKDGLAMSSRNRYLSPEERAQAAVLFRALEKTRTAFEKGERSARALELAARDELGSVPDFRVQYCEVRGLPNLSEISTLEEGPAALAIAGYLGNTRLIDNHVFA